MKINFAIEIEQYISSLSEEERIEYKDLIRSVSDLLYIADDIRSNPEEIVITNERKTELVKSLTCALFDLYLTVEENRGDAVGRGVTIEINTSWDADIDWSKASQA